MKLLSVSLILTYILGQYLSCSTPARNAFLKGRELQQAGKYEEALGYFEKGLAYDPDSPLLNFRKGECLAKLERWEEAKTTFELFLKLTDAEAELWKEERWEAEFYVKKARKELGEEEQKEDKDERSTENPSSADEDYVGGINIITR